ncbi:MAG TPA: glycosyltransferase N-terminal domain-containing protein [Thermoanaerobaculia bacterium]|nr:glycosyltransferase N-terminal domain-containing protein [Thermoanaerobaculia bacterium]
MVLYRLAFGLGLVAYAPFAFLRQAAGGRKIGDWKGRFGLSALPRFSRSIWIHGVSVGEVNAARTILEALRAETGGPFVLSSSTAAGLAAAAGVRAADGAIPFPLDLARPVERALDAADPSLVLLTETEIWPLFLDRCARRGIPVAIVNGRISAASFSRYRRAGRWLAPSLERIALFAMQTPEDAERIAALGVPPPKIRVTGNVKFDAAGLERADVAARLRELAGGRRIVIAGSTHEGEEAAVLEAWSALEPRPLLVVAPRRPERFDEVFRRMRERAGECVRFSAAAGEPPAVLLDTVGDLASAFGAADAAFVGGTLAEVGGHNPIEAWAKGVPTAVGPHVANVRAIVAEGEAAGAAIPVRSSGELASAWRELLSDEPARRVRGAAAARLVESHRGAARKTAAAVLPLRKTA